MLGRLECTYMCGINEVSPAAAGLYPRVVAVSLAGARGVVEAEYGRARHTRLSVECLSRRARVHRFFAASACVVPTAARVRAAVPAVRAPVARLALQARTEVVSGRRAPHTVEHIARRAREARSHRALAVEVPRAVRLEVRVSAARQAGTFGSTFRPGAWKTRCRYARSAVEREPRTALAARHDALAPTFKPRIAPAPVPVRAVRAIETWAERRRRALGASRRHAPAACKRASWLANTAPNNASRLAHEVFAAPRRTICVRAVRRALAQRRACLIRAEVCVTGRQRGGRGAWRRA